MDAPRRKLEALLEDAAMAELSGNAERALSDLDAGMQLDPLDSRVYAKKCSLLRRAGRHDEAAACAAAFAGALPGDASAHHEAGLSLLHLKKYDEAVAAFEKALAIQPSSRAAWSNLGIALSRLGRMDKAMACYDRAAGKAPLMSVPSAAPSRARQFDDALHDVMAGMMDTGGGCVHIACGKKFCFRVSIALLVTLLEDYDLDGVALATANPSDMYRRALEKRLASRHPPYYIDVSASPTPFPPPSPPAQSLPAASPRMAPPAPAATGAGGAFVCAFELDKIASAVRTGLQRIAERYGGEEHFVLVDDFAAVEAFNGPQAVQRFMADFFTDLSRLNIFCFVLVPEKTGPGLDPSSFFSRREKLHVRGEWFRNAAGTPAAP